MKVSINFKTDDIVREEAKQVFEALGTDMTTAINMFLRYVCRAKALPTDIVSLSNKDIVDSIIEEIGRSIVKSNEDIHNGKTISSDKFFNMMEERYGFKL